MGMHVTSGAHGSGKATTTGYGVKFGILAIFALVIMIGSLFFASRITKGKHDEVVQNTRHRLELVAQGRAEVFETWLENLAHKGDRLIKSDLFRLYAAEVDGIDGDLAALFGAASVPEGINGSELAAQLPMMQNIMREFCTYSGVLSARILNEDGMAYLATDGYLPPIAPESTSLAHAAFHAAKAVISPLRKTEHGLELDIFVPIYPPEGDGEGKAVGVLMMTRQVTGKITELLSNSALSAKGERTRLLQKGEKEFREVTPWTPEGFTPVMASITIEDTGDIAFGVRTSLSDQGQQVYSMGDRINGPNWWVVQEMDHATATQPIDAYSRAVYIMVGLIFITILLSAGLVWWVQAGINSQRSADRFRQLAEQIDEQKQFIDSVNSTMQEFITLKDLEGKYIYVNEAFAESVDRTEEEVIGMDAEAVFGFDTAKRLSVADTAVIENKEQVFINESIYLQSKRYQFQISKSPYLDSHGVCRGIVEVFRDISEFVAAQEKHRRLIQRAMEALGSTIEAADPYLGGHTKLMATLTVEVCKALNLSETEIAEIETAANLSQIGKMFVPRDILTKPEKLTGEEKEVMETHVEYAYRLLKDIDIDASVLRAIYQMNERLDGSGYPKRLVGEEIRQPARVLSVLNAFCAMVRPRSHRGALGQDEVLNILRNANEQYDPLVVRALSDVLKTPSGERIIRDFA